MKLSRTVVLFAFGVSLTLIPTSGWAQDASPQADNTKVNKRDRNKGAATADKAKNDESDRKMMADIRKAVVGDSSLSTYAHNVKIVARNGKVTLKGPVRSDEEKQAVEQKATEVAGAGNVTNQLTVKAAKSTKSTGTK